MKKNKEVEKNYDQMASNWHLHYNIFAETPNLILRRDLFRKIAINNIEKSSYILDYGCGSGDIAYDLKKNGFQNIILSDLSKEMMKKANEKTSFKYIDIDNLEEKSFDNIYSIGVIAYVDNIEDYFSFLKNKLKDDGTIIFSFQNKDSILQKLNIFLRDFKLKLKGKNKATHNSYSHNEIMKSLNNQNLNIEKSYSHSFYFEFPLSLLGIRRYIVTPTIYFTDKYLGKILPTKYFATSIILIVKKNA